MATVKSFASTEIEAPIERVYAVAADIEGSSRWQSKIKYPECIERNGEEQVLVRMENDAKVRRLRATMRVTYEPPTRISWTQEEGELKQINGEWTFEDLGDDRTRATCRVEADPGRILGMVLSGPIAAVLIRQLMSSMPAGLKRFVESA